MNKWPSTNSDSSAKMEKMGVSDYGSSADRITEPPQSTRSNPMGPDPVKVTHEVKYKQYENDKRMTSDFATSNENGTKTAGFDGTDTIKPFKALADSKITTDFSK